MAYCNGMHALLSKFNAYTSQCNHVLIALNMYVLPNCAGYAEVKSEVVYGSDFCYYNCTVDHSIAPKCESHTNISVKSSPSATNMTLKTPSGVDYTISDLQRCQRYTVQVTAQVGAHKYTNQTEDTVMLGKSALKLLSSIWIIKLITDHIK